MKKFLPFLALILLIITGSSIYLFLSNKTTSLPYSQTTKDKYNSTPTPQGNNVSTYKNMQYHFSIDYPKKGLNPEQKLIECGNFINNDDTQILSPDHAITLDNLAVIDVISSNKSVSDYIKSQGAEGLYNEFPILNSGADEAISLNGLKQTWTGEGYAPMGYVMDIYRKSGNLFIIMSTQNFINAGCLNPKGIQNPPSGVDTSWKIEDNLRFY